MYLNLGGRERQIMDAIYKLGRATVSEVLTEIPDPPSYSTVRTMLGKLERKGQIRHVEDGPRYVYYAAQPLRAAQTTALRRVLRNLFDNSPRRAVAALLDVSQPISDEEFDDLERLLAARRQRKGRKR
jgi:predicted transcriptional regulator